MRKIIKGKEPASLTSHRLQDYADYDNYPHKNDLRAALVRDQKGICCYCMAAIEPSESGMKIEHWKCQNRFPKDDLKYANLLGACLGNKGQPKNLQHCDTFKGDLDLSFNPSQSLYNIEETIEYLGDGRIKSSKPDFNRDMNGVLNLNNPILIGKRKKILSGFTDSLGSRGELKRKDILRLITQWGGDENSDHDRLEPFCQVIIFWLRKRLNRLEK